MKTKIVNLYGGPGSGKSTMAAGIYHELKAQGHSTELVTEFVKEWAYEGKKIDWYHQVLLFGQQLSREAALYDKVEYIVTDSPIFLSMYYEQHYQFPNFLGPMISALKAEINKRGIEVVNLYLPINSYAAYKQEGRYQNQSEAMDIHDTLLEWLNKNFDIVELETRNPKEIVEMILNE